MNETTHVPGEVTRLLQMAGQGDHSALERILPLVYGELKALAAARLGGERTDHTLQPTALVHEAWLRLTARAEADWRDRLHFLRAAARTMRYILVDHARHHQRLKRGGKTQTAPLHESMAVFQERAVDLVDLDVALQRLESLAPRQSEIIGMRFFVGLSMREIADVLGISERTAQYEWRSARAWLRREISAA